MMYYKVKPEFDNQVISFRYDILIGNELLTKSEFSKAKLQYEKLKAKRPFETMFDTIEHSSKKTYWFFGARYAN